MLDHQHCHYLEQEEDKLSTKVYQVEGGGGASAEAGHLGHDKSFEKVQNKAIQQR